MKLVKYVAAVILAATVSSAYPHGQPKAQHGGVVASANDLSFELVPQGTQTALYVFDHDRPIEVQAFSGKLTVLAGTTKTAAELKPVGANRLEAQLVVPKGAKVVATLNANDRAPMTVRFTVK